MSKNKEDLLKEIKEYEVKLKASRNPSEQGILSDKITLAKKELKKLDEKVFEKNIVPSKDVAAVVDHGKKKNNSIRGMIAGSATTVDI